MSEKVLAWYFCRNDRKLRYGDGRTIIDGETIAVEGAPVLCRWGLHASERLLDALTYAPGLRLCRVEVGGTVVRGNDKIVGTERKVLWSVDAADLVVRFAQWCADRAKEHANAAAADYAANAATYAATYAANTATYATYAANAANADAYAANTAIAAGTATSAAAYAAYAATATSADAYAATAAEYAAAYAATAATSAAVYARAAATSAAAYAANAATYAAERALQEVWLVREVEAVNATHKVQ